MGPSVSWFTEKYTPHDLRSHQLRKIILRSKTLFQDAVLADSYAFGRCLILNNEIQSAEIDEFIYHEGLVHPAMVLHPHPRDILILGGGEGATVREILKHPSVRRVTMVDIDREVVEFCRKYLGGWHQGALDHAKTRLVIKDARSYVRDTKETFDIIISDLPTPATTDADPVSALYTSDFYALLAQRLKPGGIFVAQSGSGNWLHIRFHAKLYRTLQKHFKVVRPYYVFIPSFDEPWAFLVASQKMDPREISAAQVDKRLGTLGKMLRFYDGETHEGLFRIPKYLRKI
jgi:spermidine synthase